MMAVVAAILAFVAVASLVLVLVSGSRDPSVERRLARIRLAPEEQGAIGNVLRNDAGTFPFLRWFVTGGWAERTRVQLAQAGLSLRVSEYLILRVLAGAGVAASIVVATAGSTVGLLAAIAGGLAGSLIPMVIVAVIRARRQAKMEAQLPEALALMAGSLRSGFAFTQSVELAAKQLSSPIKDELDRVIRDTSLGASAESALEQLSVRTGSYDIDLMVSSVLVQRTTGGNLSEILDNVAETVRERDRLQNDIKAITSSQRLTGLVLMVYPIGLWLILTAIAPSIYKVLVTEPEGRILLAIALTLQVLGALTIRRILKLEV
jgi:tight adherence protein B